MRLSSLLPLLIASLASAASWSFKDASLAVQELKGSELGAKKVLSPEKLLSDPVSLSATGSIRLTLTVTNAGHPRKPHQVFLTVTDPKSGLEEAFPMNINDNGKAKFDITQAKIPSALLTSKSLRASIIIGGFGSSTPHKSALFNIDLPENKPGAPSESLRYGKLPEIHHIFGTDAKSPPRLLTLLFTLPVLAAFPALIVTWVALGANVKHLSKALAAAPISHALFFGSIVGMEFVFYMYYTSWRLFQVLPVAGAFGLVAFLSGSGALTEVQERRLNGER